VAHTACHGEVAGIEGRAIARERRTMFRMRSFLSREALDAVEQRIWKKLTPTPGIQGRAYLPKYAFG